MHDQLTDTQLTGCSGRTDNAVEQPRLLVAFALPDEQVEVHVPGFTTIPIITRITKPYAAVSLARAIVEHQPDAVLNVGTAGTLRYDVGDILVCHRFVDRDIARQDFTSVASEILSDPPVGISLPSVVKGQPRQATFTVNTGDDFVTSGETVDGDVVDMEAFALALTCQEWGIPFMAVKYVTDVIGRNSMQIWEERLGDARRALSRYFQSYAGK